MKKFYFIIALLGIAMMSFAKNAKETKEFLETTKIGVTSIHEDVKSIVSTTHQDIKDITTTLYGDGKDAATALYPDIKQAIVAIAQAIGVAAEHVYTVLVKKFIVDAIVQSFPFLLGLLLIGIGWYKMANFFKTKDKVDWHIIYPTLMLLFGLIALSCVDYNTMVMGFVNPEYGALNYILEYSKAMIK